MVCGPKEEIRWCVVDVLIAPDMRPPFQWSLRQADGHGRRPFLILSCHYSNEGGGGGGQYVVCVD